MIIDMFAYDNHFIIRGSCSRMIIISSSGFMFAYDNDNVASIVVSMSCLRLDRFACTVCCHGAFDNQPNLQCLYLFPPR